MKSVLVITPCAPDGLPTQGAAIAKQLQCSGVRVSLLSRVKSRWGRLVDIVLRGFFLVPAHDVTLINMYGEKAFVYESAAILQTRLWRKRSVVFIRNGAMPEFVEKWPRWTRFILLQADLRLVPHRFLQDKLCSLGVPIEGFIPNFIELEKYSFRERAVLAPRFLYLRGMHPIYNPAMALRAFAIIQRTYPEAWLTMAGRDGPDAALCRTLVHDLHLRNVHFVGQVPKEDIPKLADAHDIHLHTNRVENMPVSIIEMWACGVPIVGTNVGGMPYLVRDGVDGLLVASEDFQAMAQASCNLLANSELALQLSRNGRRRTQEFTWEGIKSAWEKALMWGD